MQHSLNEWLSSSALVGANQSYIEDLYESYLEVGRKFLKHCQNPPHLSKRIQRCAIISAV